MGIKRFIAAAVCGVAALAVVPAPAQAAGSTGSLGGQLTNSAGGPVAGIAVRLSSTTNSFIAQTTTDANGSYRFDSVKVGNYRVRYTYAFNTVWSHNKSSVTTANVFTVAANALTTVDDVAPDLGNLAVTVTDSATGAGLAGIQVRATSGPSFFVVHTDSAGTANVNGVLAGTYAIDITDGTGNYFGAAADNLAVTLNQTTPVAFALDATAGADVTMVDATTGAPVANACLWLLLPGQHNVAGSSTSCSGADGTARLRMFGPGPVRFFVAPADGVHGAQWVGDNGGTGDLDQAKWFTLVGGQTTATTVRLDPAGSISGVITDSATQAGVSGICPSVAPASLGEQPTSMVSTICSGSTGQYSVSGLGPYDWKLEFPDYTGAHAWTWSGGAVDRTSATPVPVQAGATATADVALPTAGAVTGTVTKATGTLGYTLIYTTVPATDDYAGPYAVTSASAGGAYTLGGLNDGDVQVTFDDPASVGHPYPTTVHVTTGSTVTGVDFTMP